MDSIISKVSQETIFEKGRKLLKENSFFHDLDTIMSQPEFRSFYQKYFTDITDMKTVLMYMKLYDLLQTEYKQRDFHAEQEKETLAFMLKEFISNPTTRKYLVKKFSDTLSSGSSLSIENDS